MSINLPTPFGSDGRWLTLRSLRVHDAEALQPMLDDSAIRAGLRWVEGEKRDAAAWIADVLQQEQWQYPREYYVFGIVPGGSNVLAGILSVKAGWKPDAMPLVLSCELMIFLDASKRGLGYSTMATARVRDWCFEELEVALPDGTTVRPGEVCAACLPGNAASEAALEKLFGHGTPITSPEGVEVLRFRQSKADYEPAQ